MSLGEEHKIESMCDYAIYEETELEQIVDALNSEENLSEMVESIVNQYIKGRTLTDKQENVLCYEYTERYKKKICLIG